jgi:hypothetical protein
MAAGHQAGEHQGRMSREMPILRKMLGRKPSGSKARASGTSLPTHASVLKARQFMKT